MSDFYYFSEEVARSELPVRCRITKYLTVEGWKEKAAVIETAHNIYDVEASAWVVLAKGNDVISEVFSAKLIGVYLMAMDQRVMFDTLDISSGLRPVQDWGALTLTRADADAWQIR